MVLCFRQKPSPVFLKGLQNERKTTNIYIPALQCANEEAEKKVSDILEQNVKPFSQKPKSVGAGGIEWTVEVRIQERTTQFINQLYAIEGVASATLVSYNGEYMA